MSRMKNGKMYTASAEMSRSVYTSPFPSFSFSAFRFFVSLSVSLSFWLRCFQCCVSKIPTCGGRRVGSGGCFWGGTFFFWIPQRVVGLGGSENIFASVLLPPASFCLRVYYPHCTILPQESFAWEGFRSLPKFLYVSDSSRSMVYTKHVFRGGIYCSITIFPISIARSRMTSWTSFNLHGSWH